MMVSKQNGDACSLVCKDWTGRRRINQSREWCDRWVSIANVMVTWITLGHAEGNVTKCCDKTSYVIELETIHVSRRHFRNILRHCPAKDKKGDSPFSQHSRKFIPNPVPTMIAMKKKKDTFGVYSSMHGSLIVDTILNIKDESPRIMWNQ